MNVILNFNNEINYIFINFIKIFFVFIHLIILLIMLFVLFFIVIFFYLIYKVKVKTLFVFGIIFKSQLFIH
jgi:hypothetical protein